jgi:hypothetical protein
MVICLGCRLTAFTLSLSQLDSVRRRSVTLCSVSGPTEAAGRGGPAALSGLLQSMEEEEEELRLYTLYRLVSAPSSGCC